ncbi:MAG: hypothetical protein GY753_05235 [Gammaproteobacteria bacterium]|nr:hypothetical protein [Gammaproteobacteria bacterium]
MLNYLKIFVTVIFIACVVITGQVFAYEAVSINAKLIVVGSSDEVWALDASDNTLLYRRNPNTFRYKKISSNIAVDALDVSLDGVVVALSGNKLYLWDKDSQSFALQGSSQQLDQISIGDGAIWGLSGRTAYRWDSDNSDFVKISGAFSTLTVAKEDDAVYAIGLDGKLYHWDESYEDWETFVIQLYDITQLSARSASTLWALTAGGKLYQWNPLSKGFVHQTDKLPPGAPLTHFALGSQEMFYGINANGVMFQPMADFSIEVDQTKMHTKPVLTMDSKGTSHLVFNHEGQVYHSYAPSSFRASPSWVAAKSIPQSVNGTDLNILVDSDGQVHASWISGTENNSEIYYAAGTPDNQVGGYTWSSPVPISNDEVADKDMTMMLSSAGQPLFLTSKVDIHNPHADRDLYHHSYNAVEAPLTYDQTPAQLERKELVWKVDPLHGFMVAPQDNLQSKYTFSGASLTGGGATFSREWETANKAFDFKLGFQTGIPISVANGMELTASIQATAEMDLIKFLKSMGANLSAEVSEIKLSLDLQGTWVVAGEEAGKGTIVFSFAVEVGIPIYSNNSDEALIFVQKVVDVKFDVSVLLELEVEIVKIEGGGEELALSDTSGLLGANSNLIAGFLGVFKGAGNKADPNSPISSLSSQNEPFSVAFYWDEFETYFMNLFTSMLSSTSNTPELSSQALLGSTEWLSELKLGAGLRLEWNSDFMKVRGDIINYWIQDNRSGEVEKMQQKFDLSTKIGSWRWTLLNLTFTENLSSGTAVAAIPSVSYSPGGTRTLYASSPVLDDDGGSNILDEGAISSVIVDQDVYGAFVQETGDSTFQAVYIITGQVDTTNAAITWYTNTIHKIPGSEGFNGDPVVVAYDDPATQSDADQLVVAWGSVPAASSDLVDSLANTPPGRVYLAYGQDADQEAIDISEFSTAPDSTGPGFYLTNDLALYAIGSSVGQLGDVDGNGIDDFIFGAPDAEVEVGRAYVVFGEELQWANVTPSAASASWTSQKNADGYWEVRISFMGDDADGDGILRGRGKNSIIDSSYSNELTSWSMAVYQNDSLQAQYSWDDVHTNSAFNFNYDTRTEQVFTQGTIDDESKGVNGLWIGPSKSGYILSYRYDSGNLNEMRLVNSDFSHEAVKNYGSNSENNKFKVLDSPNFQPDIDALDGIHGFVMAGASDSELGYAVSSAGDFNNDGKPDLMVSAPGANDHLGAVYILYGGSSLNSTTGIVDAAKNNLPGIVLIGEESDERLGIAISAGLDSSGKALDVTGNGKGDIAAGAGGSNSVFLYTDPSDASSRLEIGYKKEVTTGNPAFPIGQSVALIPSIDGDSYADLAVGSQGRAFVIFGGPRLVTYAQNYVTSWSATGSNGDAYQVLLSFNGTDDGDGILRGRVDPSQVDGQKNELSAWLMEVYKNDSLVVSYNWQTEQSRADFNFNYDIEKEQVLASSIAGGFTATSLNVGLGSGDSGYNFHTDKGLAEITLVDRSTNSSVATSQLGTTQFLTLCPDSSFDLSALAILPGMGLVLETHLAAPLQVAHAGDINGDNLPDLAVGYGASQDADQNPINGQSYLLYGSSNLKDPASASINLDEIVANQQGYIFDQAGGTLSTAEDVNGDGIDDLIVGAVGALSATKTYVLFGTKNGDPTIGLQYTSLDSLNLFGSAVAAAGDINGDGKTDLLIGAPYSADMNLVSSLQEARQIRYVAQTLDPGSSSAATFSGTTASGISPQAAGETGLGSLLTWVESTGDSLPIYTLYGAFWKGSGWENTMLIRQTSGVISHVSISDPNNQKSSASSVPKVLWQETDKSRGDLPAIWQANYNNSSGNWNVYPVQITADESSQPSATNDESQLAVGSSYYNVEDIVVSEGDETATFTVTRSGDVSKPHELRYRTVDMTATAGADYVHTHGKLMFKRGERSKQIHIPLKQDEIYERGGERVLMELRSLDRHAFIHRNGLRLSGTPVATAQMLVSDDDRLLELTSINSGFIVLGDTATALGNAVHPAGDINSDGYADFLVGAPWSDEGEAYLVYGKESIELDEQNMYLGSMNNSQGVMLTGTVDSSYAGQSVAGGTAGSSTNVPFLAIGAPGNKSSKGQVYVLTMGMLSGKSQLTLNSGSALVLSLDGTKNGDQFGFTMTAGDVDKNGFDDLIIVAPGAGAASTPGQVYIVYDKLLAAATRGTIAINSSNANVDVISITSGNGFGTALAVGDFNNDSYNDLVLGSTRAGAIQDQYGMPRGNGGEVYLIWGKKGRPGNKDIKSLGSAGMTLAGEAYFAGSKGSATGDPYSMLPQQGAAPSFALIDRIGNAVAMLDLNGDKKKDLAIGAPGAYIAGADGIIEREDASIGRVYVLFGGADWKTKHSGKTYQLTELYGNDYKSGIILEGTMPQGMVGSSLSNVGAFRGATDSIGEFFVEDLLIGAPTVNVNAGQAYLVFGSGNRYDVQAIEENALTLNPYGNPSDLSVPLMFTYQGVNNPVSDYTQTNTGSIGKSLAGVGDINNDGSTDIVIGAPTVNVNGHTQVYVPIGHPWIPPGQSLNLKHLRSDNGFVLPGTGEMPVPVGDVNGDGYDDVVTLGESPELILGATALANKNGVRQFELLPNNQVLTSTDSTIVEATASVTIGGYSIQLSFAGVDKDNDGILRGRTDPSQIDGGYTDELTKWIMIVDYKTTYSWADKEALADFNFNYNINKQQVIASNSDNHNVNGLKIGSGETNSGYLLYTSPGLTSLSATQPTQLGEDHPIHFINLKDLSTNKVVGDIQSGNNRFNVQAFPVVVGYTGGYQVTWNAGESDYKVVIDFDGTDNDGDGILRGRGPEPVAVAKGSADATFGNELTGFLMRVYQGSELFFTYQLEEQQQRSDFNFNYDLISQEVVAEDQWNTGQGINLGIWNIVGVYNFSSWGSDAVIKLQLINDVQGKDRSDVGTTPLGSGNFQLTRQPALPKAQLKMYHARWKGENKWTVDLYFIGSDRTGDGYISGFAGLTKHPTNEVTEFNMVVTNENGIIKMDWPTKRVFENGTLYFNFLVKKQQVRASGNATTGYTGLTIGSSPEPDYLFTTETSGSKLQLDQFSTRIDYSNRGDDLFTVTSSPLSRVSGPLAAGDFNGDSYEDFILFTNLGTLHPMAVAGAGKESLPAFIYYGNENPSVTVAAPDTIAVPLSYISGAKTGDINGDGYHDLVISGYNDNISDVATSKDKSYLLAYYGSADPIDLSTPDAVLYEETNYISRYVLALLDITNNGQDDIVTYTLKRDTATTPPLPYLREEMPMNQSLNKIERLYTYGSEDVGGTPSWHGPILLQDNIIPYERQQTDLILGLAAGSQVDVDNDDKVDLIFSAHAAFGSTDPFPPYTVNYILHSTGNFTFVDGNGNWKTSVLNYSPAGYKIITDMNLANPESAAFQSRIIGIRDFNLDGIDDVLVTPGHPEDTDGKAIYSYIIYGSESLPGTSMTLDYQDETFTAGIPIKGFRNMAAPYGACTAGDLNGDGHGDIFMSDATSGLYFGIYGYIPDADTSQTVDYITGSDDDDVLQQVPSTATLVNVSGKGGDDFIQTVRTVKGKTTPYKLVLHGGPGDDQIGISSVDGSVITRIDGGNGFDKLQINPYYSGGAETLDLTVVGRRIKNIELIDLGESNGIDFSFLEVRNISENNTLLLRGTDARAKPLNGKNWSYIGQNSHDGVLYNVYEHLPEGDINNLGKSDIQVWVEHDGVNWTPLE